METTSYTTTVLTAEPGHMLTQAADVDILERVFTDKAYLAANDSPGNWREISADEVIELRQQQHEARQALEAQQRAEEEAARQAAMAERQ